MDALLVVAIIVTALAVLTQTGVLVAMYLMSRRITTKVDGLITESNRIMAPLEDVTRNLKTTSADLADVGKVAREQLRHIQSMVAETRSALTGVTSDVRRQVNSGAGEIRERVVAPVREWSAIAFAVAEGFRVLFRGRERRGREDTAA